MKRPTIARLALGALACAPAAASLADPAAIATEARCVACHHATDKRMGPAWTAIRERYAGDTEIIDTLASRVRAGGAGEWGKIPMPPATESQISDDDLQAVIRWILEG